MNFPAIKNEMDEYAKGLLYQVIPNNSWSNVCYTYRISNKLAGSVYKIALNDKLPEELKEWLLCVELCHIKRQHYAAKQTLDYRFSAPKIRAVYDRLKPLFDDPVSDIDNMYDIFEDYIFKMLRDWEVFTNDFTEDEVRYLDTLYPDECIIDGQPVVHLLPQDVGYPPGLTANEYLLLILQNPEQWFTNQMSAMQQAMDDLKQRKQNNGTQGGCNTNQSGASSSNGGAEDQNHNKEDRERPKKNPPQNQHGGQNGQKGGQNGQQNQQPQNQQGGQNGQNQDGQDDQGMGSSQQNQDAAANTQQQEWKDGKDSNGGSNNSLGKQSNNDKSEQDGQSSGGSSDGQEGVDNEQNQASGGNSSDKTASEDKDSDGDTSGGSGSQEEVGDAGTQDESRSGSSSSDSDKGDSDDADGENQAGGSRSSDEDNEEDGSESESSDSGATTSDNAEDGEDNSGETSGEEGSETTDGDGKSSDDGSEGSNNDASDTKEDGGERRELTKEELEELIKQFVQKAVSDYQKMLEIKDEQQADSDSLKGYSRDSGGGAGNGTVLVDKCTNWIDFEGLEKEIRELMINRCVTVSKRDLLYNYNRGRGCGNVLTPRYREQTTYDEVPMTVVLDVSGSISDKNILGFCNIFKNVSKTCGKKCKIIMWDTDLRAVYDSGDDIKAVSGGGTDIGKGIDYVRKNFQPSEIGNLFVVSDCEDDLEDWSLEGFEQPYLVCWSSMDVIQRYTGSLFNEFVDSFEKILVKK